MTTSPVPGLVLPSPRTWTAGDAITAPRMRDVTNLANLFTAGRPMFAVYGQTIVGPVPSGVNLIPWSTISVDNWSTAVGNAGPGNPSPYFVPLAGWYLAEGNVAQFPVSGGSTGRYEVGVQAVINGNTARDFPGSSVPYVTSGSDPVGGSCAELFQLNPFESDTLSWYINTTNSTGITYSAIHAQAQWVAMPTSGLTNYTGPYGTVVSSPVFAASFPSGPGTTVAGNVAVGATSITVADATGMVTGGTLGLDFINGAMYSAVAEAVSITSVAGTTIGISATAFPHANGAPVAVPYSAAFLNQQVRDAVNYLVYPPFCRLQSNTSQSIPSTGFPPTVGGNPTCQITGFSPGSVPGQPNADNFSATSSTAFTAPVAGVYYVYGQVSFAGATAVAGYAAGISVNGGTIGWGTLTRSAGGTAITICPTVRRHLRLTAGQTITLWGFQNSGAGMSTNASGTDHSKLICLWRST